MMSRFWGNRVRTMSRQALSVGLGFALLALASGLAQAATIRVPADQPTIKAGVNAAQDGDEVVVAPGIYHENRIFFNRKNITLRSTFAGDWSVVRNTVIDGGVGWDGIIGFQGTESSSCTLRGFTITRLNHTNEVTPEGIQGVGTHATIEYNIISNNSHIAPSYGSSAYTGGGISECNGLIQNNIIQNNVANQGGGLYGCNGIIQNNLITGNRVVSSGHLYAEGEAIDYCSGVIRNNTIANNGVARPGSDAGGIENCSGIIMNNIIWHNYPNTALTIYNSSTPSYCMIKDYAGPGQGNISGDPKFVDPSSGDFRLRPDSPCIDAGKRLSDVKADFDGHQRGLKTGVQGRGDGSGADIGAFEALPKPVALWLPDGGPALARAGDSLSLALQLDPEAGTALCLKLMRDGSPVANLGLVLAPGGAAVSQVRLPYGLVTPAEYTIQGANPCDPTTYVSSTASFTIEPPLPSAVAPAVWQQYM